MLQIEPSKQKVFDWCSAWNKRDLSGADALFADDFVFTGRDRDWTLPDLKAWYLELVSNYPAIEASVDSLLVEDDRIAIRWSMREHGALISKGGGLGTFENGMLKSMTGLTSDIPAKTAPSASLDADSIRDKVMAWSEAWNKRDLAASDVFFAEDFVYEGGEKNWTLPELKEWYLGLNDEMPNIRNRVDELIVQGNAIGISWTLLDGDRVVSVGGGVGTFDGEKLSRFVGLTTD